MTVKNLNNKNDADLLLQHEDNEDESRAYWFIGDVVVDIDVDDDGDVSVHAFDKNDEKLVSAILSELERDFKLHALSATAELWAAEHGLTEEEEFERYDEYGPYFG